MLLEMLFVVAISDGDTLKIIDNNGKYQKVRLANIDAPEYNKRNPYNQPFGKESRDMLSKLVYRKRVDLDCQKKRSYKRLICTVYDSHGVDINHQMVKQGGAWVSRKYYKGHAYIKSENKAKRNQLGLWWPSVKNAVAPWIWRRSANMSNRR